MKKYLLIPACAMALIVPVTVLASGGVRGFNGVVDAIEAQYHVRATRIPFMGLISGMPGEDEPKKPEGGKYA